MKEKVIMDYEWISLNHTSKSCLKNLVSAMLLSAIDDCDLEFFEDDYEKWKLLRKKDGSQRLCESEYLKEFEDKQEYKSLLFNIIEVEIKPSDIPQSKIDERKFYENHSLNELVEITHYDKNTICKFANLHGWNIGCNCKVQSIFDL